MVTEKVLNSSKIWIRFYKAVKNGMKLKFHWEQLPENRFDEFIDFKIKYYVKHELTHVAAGIYKNPQAVDEYKQNLSKLFKQPSYHNFICCLDDEKSEMVAIDCTKIYKKGEIYSDIIMPAQTAEVKRLSQIFHDLNNLCPVPELLIKYGVNTFLDDVGIAVHPEYRGYGFTTEASLLRCKICKAYGAPLTGAWITSSATAKVTENDGWEIVYKISSEKMEKILGVQFQNAPPMFVYKVKRIE